VRARVRPGTEAEFNPRICTPKRPPTTSPEAALYAPSREFIGPNLPCFTKRLSDNDYKWWVMEQNEIAYEQARLDRDNSARGTVVHQSQVYGPSAGVRYGGFNNYSTREFSTIAPGSTPYGGGGVWIHNPFVRQ
jgi:hypothetical protein